MMSNKREEILERYKIHFGHMFPIRKYIKTSDDKLESIINKCINENKTYTEMMREKYGKDIML